MKDLKYKNRIKLYSKCANICLVLSIHYLPVMSKILSKLSKFLSQFTDEATFNKWISINILIINPYMPL